MKKIIGIVFSLVLVLMFLVCSMSCLPAYAVAETTETELHENDISATTEESVRPALPLRSTTEKTEEDETESTDAGTSEAEQGTTEANIEADQEGLVEPETSTVNETDAAGETEPFNLRQKLNKKTMVIIAAAVASVLVTAIVCIARGKSAQSTARGTDAEIDPREDHKTTANSTEKDLPMYMTSITYEPDKSAPINVVRVHNVGKRKNQEDSFGVSNIKDDSLCRTKGVMAVVADGMGGLQGGEDVSSIAVISMLQGFSDLHHSGTSEQELDRLLRTTVKNVNDHLERTVGLKKAGSTLMAVILRDRKLSWISVGDSRTALFRDGRLTDLNRKHIFAAELDEMAKQGRITEQQAKTHPARDKLTSYIGMGELKYTDRSVRPMQLNTGDKVILMSDGVFNTLTDAEIEQILTLPIDLIGERLEKSVLQKNNPYQDNFTAVILEIPRN